MHLVAFVILLAILATSGCLLYGFFLIVTSVTAHYDQMICSNCGYDLRRRTNSDVCPECGGKFTKAELRIDRRPGRMIAGVCVVGLSGVGLLVGVYVSMHFN